MANDLTKDEQDGIDRHIDAVLKQYGDFINGAPGLLSVLYDVDLLPEQMHHVAKHNPRLAIVNCSRMALICELWKHQADPPK